MQDRTQEMLGAIKEKSLTKVKELLDQQPGEWKGVQIVDDKSLLYHAMSSGNVAIVEALVEAGALVPQYEIKSGNFFPDVQEAVADAIDAPLPERVPPKIPTKKMPPLPELAAEVLIQEDMPAAPEYAPPAVPAGKAIRSLTKKEAEYKAVMDEAQKKYEGVLEARNQQAKGDLSDKIKQANIDLKAAQKGLEDAQTNFRRAQYSRVIDDFTNEFHNIIGDRGRDSSVYLALRSEIHEMQKLVAKEIPGTVPFSEAMQPHMDNVQSLMGQLYADNVSLQQHMSIKGFMGNVKKISQDMVARLPMVTPKYNLVAKSNFVLEPIVHGAAHDKIKTHSSAIKNAEDFKFLQAQLKTARGDFRDDLGKGMEKFAVVDKFKLAQIIKNDPDRVVRYLLAVAAKKEKGAEVGQQEVIGEIANMLETFSSDKTKDKMEYIVDKLSGGIKPKATVWEAIAAPFVDAINAVKKGVESITGYDDITDAMRELGEMHRIYGSLFKGQETAKEEAKGFAGKLLQTRHRDANAVEAGAPFFAKELSGIRNAVDKLIGDNGRGSGQYTALLNALDNLARESPQNKDNKFQAKLDRISKIMADLYVDNPSIHQNVPLRDYSEGINNAVMALATRVNQVVSEVKVVGAPKKQAIHSSTKHIIIETLSEARDLSYGSDARNVDAYNYLSKQNKIPELGDAMEKFAKKDNFKLAELINKDPDRVMRVMKEMLARKVLLPQPGDESIEKAATVLNYLSSNETKNNMQRICNGLGQESVPVMSMFAQFIAAVQDKIGWLTGFDKEVESAFKELAAITVLQHDVIEKYAKADLSLDETKGNVKSFVARVSKPSAEPQIR